jgi:hypothetical protein
MRHVRIALLALGTALAVSVAARADDDAAARALVAKAIAAQGGEEKLTKHPASISKMKGNFHGMGEAIPFTGEITVQGADRMKLVIDVEAGGQKFKVVNVLQGDKGWTKFGDAVKEMDKDELAEAKEQAYAGWVATLVPLKDKAFTLASIGEVEIEKKPALGVKVTSKDHRVVDLFFDKATGHLVKSETRVKDDGGQEVNEETFFGEYKAMDGLNVSMKFTVKRDGKLYLEGELTEVQFADKQDDSVFGKP